MEREEGERPTKIFPSSRQSEACEREELAYLLKKKKKKKRPFCK